VSASAVFAGIAASMELKRLDFDSSVMLALFL
jgi:hypothetical protein